MILALPEGLETARLRFDRVDESTASEWLPFFHNEDSIKYLGLGHGSPDELCSSWMQKNEQRNAEGHGLMALKSKEQNELIGMAGLIIKNLDGREVVEISYHILPDRRNEGYASEAARALKRYAFDAEYTTELVSLIHVDNELSKKVAHRNGMLPNGKSVQRDLPVEVYRVTKYLDKVSFGEYLGAGFVLFLLLILIGYLVSLGMEKWGG